MYFIYNVLYLGTSAQHLPKHRRATQLAPQKGKGGKGKQKHKTQGKVRKGNGQKETQSRAKRPHTEPQGYVWSSDPTPVTVEPFQGSPGPTHPISNDPLEMFSCFFSNELMEQIVSETNRLQLST